MPEFDFDFGGEEKEGSEEKEGEKGPKPEEATEAAPEFLAKFY